MIRHMKGALAAVVLTAFPAVAGPSCIHPAEQKADQVRFVQTQLNVAALLCKSNQHKGIAAYYNIFIKKNRHHLIKSKAPMLAYLDRAGLSVDTYLTRMSNNVSLASMDVAGFCDLALAAATYAAAQRSPLDALSVMPVAYRPPSPRCGVAFDTAAAGTVQAGQP